MRDYIVRYRDTPEKHQRAEARAAAGRFTTEDDALLGTIPDTEAAKRLGKTPNAIWKRRQRLGIPAHRGHKGGRTEYVTEDGYRVIKLLPGDPLHDMTRKGGYVMEHRLVKARELGRPLTQDEIVHHRNGIKHDNRPENLELWTRAHPDGQRVEDVFAFCIEFIERYADEFHTA